MNTYTVQDKQTVYNYPYGRLRTTAYFSVEFQPKKGFRSVFQTINPKTGRVNKEKKGVYHDIMYMSNVDGFVKFHSKEFYKIEDFNELTQWLRDNFALFTPEQMKYIYAKAVSFLNMELYALKVYCNVEPKDSKPFVEPAQIEAVSGVSNPTANLWNSIKVDYVKLEALKDPNFNPFKVTSYGI